MDNSYLWEFLSTSDEMFIVDSFIKADSVINSPKYKVITASISGGSDSDIVLDLITRVDRSKKVKYVWFDTGLEYQATKDHLIYLEEKYGIKIERERAIKSIPLTCKEFGQPFKSKIVSEMIGRLQAHGFQWEDESFEELYKKYPKCKCSLMWWTNKYFEQKYKFKSYSMYDIGYNKYLKEFLMQNPPTFKISSKCCYYAKKKPGKIIDKKYGADLKIIGVRKAEGGIRSTVYKNCFDNRDGTSQYRPVFWYSDDVKREYEKKFDIVHSDCYKKYGFRRTGCACCPYAKDLEGELIALEMYEPQLYKAVCNVFKDSYEYTRKYRKFVEMMKLKDDKKQIKGQMNITDFLEE